MATSVLDLAAADVERLHADIDRYLVEHARPATAHPLVTKPTGELVAEALGTQPAAPTPTLSPPSPLLRRLPERAWRLVGAARPRRPVTVSEYIGLLVMVLERHGWTGSGTLRTRSGCRCIAGAQELLAHLGYGSPTTAAEAGRAVQRVLTRRGITAPYWEWNDAPSRSRGEVLAVLRDAAGVA